LRSKEDVIRRLVREGTKQRSLSYKHVSKGIPNSLFTPEVLDDVYTALHESGIEVIDEEARERRRLERDLQQALKHVFSQLTPFQAEVLRMRYGVFSGNPPMSHEVVAEFLGRTPAAVKRAETLALRNAKTTFDARWIERFAARQTPEARPKATSRVIAEVSRLTPDLIRHLKKDHSQLLDIPWDVFEHLVAEFFAAKGFDDVRLVGRSTDTAADVFASCFSDELGTTLRVFVEVKRTHSTVGVEVIEKVYGAMMAERPRIGWHAALIVSLAGFSAGRRYTPTQLSLMGVELRDKSDLLRWLMDYRPNESGLWLPDPLTTLDGLT